MAQNTRPHIFSREERPLWQVTAPSIWSRNGGHVVSDPVSAVLRTLFDQPPWLEAFHLYDERGARLFEQICELPEYYLTRTEESILQQRAERVIALAPVECIVELGAGFSKKTMHLLKEQVRQRCGGIFAPVDVSVTGLVASREAVCKEFPQLEFQGLKALFDQGIASVEKELPTLFVFLGSTLGNLSHSEFIRFFQHLSESMGPHDFLLLGVDRVKDEQVLERAYNDSRGLTAAFILNVFENINRLLGSDFQPDKMRYESHYEPKQQRIEMSSVSTCTQEIHFPSHRASLTLKDGDEILVEISRKFEPENLKKQLRFFALDPVEHFTDPREWFSLLLLRKVPEL